MIDVISDVSNISRIPKMTLYKIIDMSTSIMSNDVLDNVNNNVPFSEFDIGVGKLIIAADKTNVEYRFIPAKDFERKVSNSIKNNKSVFVSELEESLVNKLLLAYKELY